MVITIEVTFILSHIHVYLIYLGHVMVCIFVCKVPPVPLACAVRLAMGDHRECQEGLAPPAPAVLLALLVTRDWRGALGQLDLLELAEEPVAQVWSIQTSLLCCFHFPIYEWTTAKFVFSIFLNRCYFSGSTGPTGLTGSTGARGFEGKSGATGTSGLNGLTGATGRTGTSGRTGATGVEGPEGRDGQTGATGAQGVGEQGELDPLLTSHLLYTLSSVSYFSSLISYVLSSPVSVFLPPLSF